MQCVRCLELVLTNHRTCRSYLLDPGGRLVCRPNFNRSVVVADCSYHDKLAQLAKLQFLVLHPLSLCTGSNSALTATSSRTPSSGSNEGGLSPAFGSGGRVDVLSEIAENEIAHVRVLRAALGASAVGTVEQLLCNYILLPICVCSQGKARTFS